MRPNAEDIKLHKERVLDYLNFDRKGPRRFCNKILCSEGDNFPVHDGILGSVSDFFQALFGVEMKEKYADSVNLNNIPPKILGNIVEFIYTGDIEITEENVFDVLEDAEYTQMKCLKQYCNQFIIEILSAENCLRLRAYAQRYNLTEVECMANKVIGDSFETVVQHIDFLGLDVNDIEAICDKRNLVGSEEAAYNGIIQWVKHNPSSREKLFVSLFSQLDLSGMSSHFLTTTIRSEDLVRSHVDCSNAVMDAALGVFQSAGTRDPDCVLIIGGENAERECQKYDFDSKTHEEIPKLNEHRRWSTSALVKDKVLVIGGCNYEPLKTCEMLNLDKSEGWIMKAEMLNARNFSASAVVCDKVYIAGGVNSTGKLSSCEVYGLHRNLWQTVSDMVHKRMGHGMCSFGNSIYSIGGSDGSGKPCEHMDVRCGKWELLPEMNEGRFQLSSVAFNEEVYAIGGWGKSTVECYSPVAGKWRKLKSMDSARCNPRACVLGGKIYVIGGSKDLFGSIPLSSVEVYDPANDSWAICFDLDAPICGHTVVAV